MKTKKHEFQFWISWNHFSVWLFFFYICTERRKVSVFCFCFLLFPSFVLSSSRSSRLLLRPSTYSSLRSSTLVFFSLFFFLFNPIIKLAFQFFSRRDSIGVSQQNIHCFDGLSLQLFFRFSNIWTISTILANLCLFKCIQKSLWSIKNSSFFTLNMKNTLNLWQAFRKK